jgi:multidrug efflux system membrane fusion protein
LNRDVAPLQNARLDLKRDEILYAHGAISQQQRDTQAAAVKQDEGVVTSDRANIQTANLQLTYSRITAPLTGRIGLRLVDQGNIVHVTDAQGLAVITQLQPIALLFSIPEDNLPQVLSGMRAGRGLPVDAYDRELKVKLATGELATFDSQIDQTTGTIRLKAVFPNDDGALFPNQFVNASLMVDTKHDATLVAAAAVQKSPQGSFVYVVKPDMTVQVRNVKVGVAQGDVVSIDSGLTPGELVVIDGVDKLQQGTKVDVQLASNSAGRRTTQ